MGGENMTAYMITYDLNAKGQKYDEVIETIKKCSFNNAWCSFWKSSWLIKSTMTPSEIQSKIQPHLDSNDDLIVIEVKNNYQGWLTDEEWKYIRENIFN